MPILDTILSIAGLAFSVDQKAKEIIGKRINIEVILAKIIEEIFDKQRNRIEPFCAEQYTLFDKKFLLKG
jgi:hypothetical protein